MENIFLKLYWSLLLILVSPTYCYIDPYSSSSSPSISTALAPLAPAPIDALVPSLVPNPSPASVLGSVHHGRPSARGLALLIVTIAVSSALFFLGARIVWSHFLLKKTLSERIVNIVEATCTGKVSLASAIPRIEQEAEAKRAIMGPLFFDMVQKSELDGVLVASILASLARINSDYKHGLGEALKHLDLKKVESENAAFNMGSFFGKLYKEKIMDISMFTHLQLSNEIAKDLPFLLPFLKGMFQNMEKFDMASQVLDHIEHFFVGDSLDDYATWLELHDSLLGIEACSVIQYQIFCLMMMASGREPRDPLVLEVNIEQ